MHVLMHTDRLSRIQKRPAMPIRTSRILKNLSRRSLVAAGVAMVATAMAPAVLAADNWPDKPLHLIVGFPQAPRPI
jgi:hypothetical protein